MEKCYCTAKLATKFGGNTEALSFGGAWGEYDGVFAYDNLGRLVTATSGNTQALSFAYDALGRQTSETSSFYGTVAASQYDLAGRRTRLTWRDGYYVDYLYDTAGDMTAIRENGATTGAGVLAVYAYNDRGLRTGVTLGNGEIAARGGAKALAPFRLCP